MTGHLDNPNSAPDLGAKFDSPPVESAEQIGCPDADGGAQAQREPDPDASLPDDSDGTHTHGTGSNVTHGPQEASVRSLSAHNVQENGASVAPDQTTATKALLHFSTVYGHTISRLDSLRTLLIDGDLVRFTPTEYRLLIPILEERGTPIPFRHLTRSVLQRDPDRDARRLLDKHIDHIRSKIRPYGLNVHSVARFGYVLLADQ